MPKIQKKSTLVPSSSRGKISNLLAIFIFAFFISWLTLGLGVGWISKFACFKYLGCNIGFFGYDFLVHFIFGLVAGIFVIWVSERFNKLSLLDGTRFKKWLVIIAFVALEGVLWETIEFTGDKLKPIVLPPTSAPYLLQSAQLSNSDTMGDLLVNLLGGIVVASIAIKKKPNGFSYFLF